MPLFAYFSCVGGVLVVFLYLSDAYWSSPRDIFRQGETNFSIKIESNYPKPELVVFDTSIPTVVPPRRAQLDAAPPVQPVANTFARLEEPMLLTKGAMRKRVAKKLVVDVAHLNPQELSGLNYPPSW